ncbi:NACHT and WD40 domain protein [Metarhizium robertsii ARSEF 23]|uniref:NACHT and WD40 domain protein n=1 Tax=Metarhizium robertsii (strain ARSEF 23 / ATCC MYA-3075) TaxID=655844 RepID=E9ESN6_METRA|nr:NACHT and WD40 domain protein [Metarhizium robertsii ARSEF 23]EFZ01753.2 NACHT and WD40 domain protein [Metarhizium robertsii ARSEF 23]
MPRHKKSKNAFSGHHLQQDGAATAPAEPVPTSHEIQASLTVPETKMSAEVTTQSFNLSQNLWNQAFDQLAKDEESLVEAYLKILAKLLLDNTLEDATAKESKEYLTQLLGRHEVSKRGDSSVPRLSQAAVKNLKAELGDHTQRQKFMSMLVEDGKAKALKSQKIAETLGNVAGTLLSVKPIVDAVLQIPQTAPAALPWAGICVGLNWEAKALLTRFRARHSHPGQPAAKVQAYRDGLAYITSRMNWYGAISHYLLSQEDKENESPALVSRILEERVRTIYQAVIVFQMKAVRYYHDNVLGQIFTAQEWDKLRQSVIDAENAFSKDWDTYKKVQAEQLWGKLMQSAKNSETQLRMMGETLEQFLSRQKNMDDESRDRECLRALFVLNPQDHMQNIENNKEKLCSDVCQWIFKHDKYVAFTDWNEGNMPTCRLLQIKAPAGMGKTMLLINIIRQHLHQPAALTSSLAYFFCQSGKSNARSAAAVPHLVNDLRREFEICGEALLTDGLGWEPISRFFKTTISREDVRPVLHISCQADLAERYIEHRLSKLCQSKLGCETFSGNIPQLVRQEIKMRKETNLLWLSFLFRTLDQTPGKQAINEIRRFPHNLRSFLPIHLDTLAIVLGYDENHNLYKYVEECNSFLVRTYSHEQGEHEINIIHNTAREWLEGNRGELLSEKMQGHADIAKNSVKAMSRLKAIDIERWNTFDIVRWTSESLFWLYHLRDAMKTNPENVKELCDIGLGFLREYSSQWLFWLQLLSRTLWVTGFRNVTQFPLGKALDSMDKFLKVLQASEPHLELNFKLN